MSSHDRPLCLRYAEALSHPNDFSGAIAAFFAADTNINVVHPFNELQRADTYLHKFCVQCRSRLMDFTNQTTFSWLVNLKDKTGSVPQATESDVLPKIGSASKQPAF